MDGPFPDLPSYVGDLSLTGDWVWLEGLSHGPHRYLACYDVRAIGRSELILPTSAAVGWEIWELSTGRILDTLAGMPEADLRVGPLFSPDYYERNLFYLADSGLYIWKGMRTTVADQEESPDSLAPLATLTAFPNPFNSTVRLDWSSNSDAAALDIFNILGQRVRTYDLSAVSGSHPSIEWDSRDFAGHQVPSGLYFARLTGTHAPVVTKLVLLK